VVTTNFAINSGLKRNNPLRRDTPAVQPHGDVRLTDPAAGDLTEPCCNSGLPAALLNGLPQRADTHRREYNTSSVIDVNTRSVMNAVKNMRMPKTAETSAFWLRLEQARKTCRPAKSMRQEDVAKDYGAAHQSTVTKWKTGKSLPKPEVLAAMADDCDVSIDWLWRGIGEMRPKRKLDYVTEQILGLIQDLSDEDKTELFKEIAARPHMKRLKAGQVSDSQMRHKKRYAIHQS
jgi:transcriptional regulator with XRE-family HTH domain